MKLEQYRRNNPALAGILDRVALIRAYQAIVDGLVSGRSGQSVQVINVDERMLTVGVSSAAMASRMRFEANDLLARLHEALKDHPGAPKPAAIRVRVVADRPTPGNPPQKRDRPPSRAGSQALGCLAEAQLDPALSRSLGRLAQLLDPDKDADD
ncbi:MULTISPECIES: DciA family protein [unclassified Guyparkeria]|uniref:DciA family protein n=1 Tax=unclassified Guyparkeria TaxID=2626246 RepID=UPI000733674E|nr:MULTISPECIES: DciA family protein [unclassified Guyparkeria]KTG17389.1 hypothetical protein AUR63_09600 [Guyparkeria sp. XI15]OAE87366.1 hypothetical protein AWR35_09620 [Guyparkeria sp. WRN-7]